MAKIKSPYSYPHKSRQAKVDYITGIGGYCSNHDRVAIEFNVGLYYVDADFDHIWAKALATETPDPSCDLAMLEDAARSVYDKETAYEWAVEDASRSLSEQGDCAYHMLWDGTPVEVKLELWGRGGKHLVITEFEGHRLTCSEELLAEEMMERDSNGDWTIWSTPTVNKLYKYVRQCEVDFTSKKASDEVEYQMAWRLMQDAVEKYDEIPTLKKDKEELDRSYRIVSSVLLDHGDVETRTALKNLALAAGVSFSS